MKICFVVSKNNKGGILDRIAKEIRRGFEDVIYYYSSHPERETELLPKADHYFVTHYALLPMVMAQVNPAVTPVTCFFTHDKGGLFHYVDQFNLCHAVVAESIQGEELLLSLGVRPELVCYVPEGGDSERFKPHQRTEDGAILVCGTNYEDGRKNPDLIHQIYKLSGRKFMFIGKGWPDGDGKEIPYSQYPEEYARCSVYLSCSKLEGGGPNSLIEAMHANLIPVVSDTGNARDYIQHGYNGFIFPVDSRPSYVAKLIERAYEFRPQDQLPFNDVWRTVTQFTWANFAMQMKEIILGDYSKTLSQGEYGAKW